MKAQKSKKEAVVAFDNMEDKRKALDTAINQITKQYGQGSIMKLGEDSSLNVTAISKG